MYFQTLCTYWKGLELATPQQQHPSTQILVSNFILQWKEPEIRGEMTDFNDKQETYMIILGYLIRPENKKVLEKQTDGDMSKGQKGQL